VGAWFCLGFLAILRIGIFVMPVAAIAAVMLATRRGSASGLASLLSGLALPFLWVAYLNRSGPGTISTAIPNGTQCTDEWSPWPWLAVGLLLVAGSVSPMFRLTSSRR
jgi:hypothetical protein